MFFDETIRSKIRRSERLQIEEITRRNPEKYPSMSDFIRIAIIKEINAYKRSLSLKDLHIFNNVIKEGD